jgi:hypothetical protein
VAVGVAGRAECPVVDEQDIDAREACEQLAVGAIRTRQRELLEEAAGSTV